MDFETRQKLAVEEVNVVLKKYGLGLQAFLNIQATGIIPAVRLVDVEVKDNVQVKANEETEKPKKAKKSK